MARLLLQDMEVFVQFDPKKENLDCSNLTFVLKFFKIGAYAPIDFFTFRMYADDYLMRCFLTISNTNLI